MKRAFTTREKVMLLVLTVLLIVIAYFKLILEPINNSIDEYQSETAAEQDEILQNTELLTRMNQMQKELEEIYAAGDPTPIPNYDNSGKLLGFRRLFAGFRSGLGIERWLHHVPPHQHDLYNEHLRRNARHH